MPPLGLVHLVRHSNGPAVLARFLAACDLCPSGVAHDLVLVCKGFPGNRLDPAHARELGDRPYRPLFVPDAGFDLVPYRTAARAVRYDHFCFTNSFSRPLGPGWLAKLYAAVLVPGVGMAGATGSWETVRAARAADRRRQVAHLSTLRGRTWLAAARRVPQRWPDDLLYWLCFPPFPAPHLRTNGFVMARHHLLSEWNGVRVNGKLDAWRFEHGRRSLTRRIARLGLRTVVVGRDGLAYDPSEWDRSNTFWQGDQGNLLVADNQTDRYAVGNAAVRAELARGAWGPP
jgi:hypothetical protein